MRKAAYLILLGSSSVVSLSFSTIAFAQVEQLQDTSEASGPSTEQADIADIIVTADRSARSLKNVPMSIAALDSKALGDLKRPDPVSLTRLVPSLVVAESQKGAPVYTIRGVGFYEESLSSTPAVAIYVDQVGIPLPAMTKGASLDIERVEVLKGPQGTQYGQNSTGGAINYIAAKPTADFSAGLTASAGNYGALSGETFVSGPLSPTLGIRLAASSDQGGGYQKSYTRGDTNGDLNLLKARLLVEWKPSSDFTLSINANGWRDRSDTLAAALYRVTPQSPSRVTSLLLNQTLAPEKPGTADWGVGRQLRNDEDFYSLSAQASYITPIGVEVSAISSYQHYKSDWFRDTGGSSIGLFQIAQDGKVRNLFEELRVSYDNNNGLYLTAGANYSNAKIHEYNETFLGDTTSATAYTAGFGTPPFNSMRPISRNQLESYAFYATGKVNITEALTFDGGLRYTKSSNDFEGCMADVDGGFAAGLTASLRRNNPSQPTIPTGSCVTIDVATGQPGLIYKSLSEDNLSWRGALNWRPNTELQIYTSISRAYKTGGFPNINATNSVQYSSVTQESNTAYEFGIRGGFGVFDVDASAFYYDYRNKQIRGRTLAGIFGASESLINVPEARSQGAEFNMTARVYDGLQIRVGLQYLDTKVTSSFVNFDPFGAVVDFEGERFPFSPKFTSTVGVRYQFDTGNNMKAFVSLDDRYQSKTTSAFGNNDLVYIKAYNLLSAEAGLIAPDDQWKVSVFGENILNEYYWTDTFRQIDNLSRHVGAPATYGIRFSLKI